MIAAAFLPLLGAFILAYRPRASSIAAALDAAGLLLTGLLWTRPDADPFGLFLAASIFAGLGFAAVSPDQDLDALARLHLGGSLGLVAALAKDPVWSVPAVVLFGLLVPLSRERLLPLLLPAMAALVGLYQGADLVVLGLSALWLVASREVLRSAGAGLVTRMAMSFLLWVGVCSVALRHPAGTALPALALGALALGAFGVLAATRITTFLTAIAVARAGLVLVAQLGGVLGRVPALIALAATGVSLLLLAAALEKTETVDDVLRLGSAPRRLALVLAALSLGSFPPFPGFHAVFPLTSAALERGHGGSLAAAAALGFLVALGSLRLVTRALEPGSARTVEARIGRAALALAAGAMVAFSISPAPLVEIARIAALGLS